MTPFPTTSLLIPIADSSQVGEARRAAASLAARVGLNETEAGKAALVTTEAATNLAKHAGNGQIVIRPLAEGARRGVEVVALDHGPGMADIARCLEDGYSTRGTPGTGLGSIKRLASLLEMYSLPGKVTALLAQVWDGNGTVPESPLQVGAVCVPVKGETVCGDAWELRASGGSVFLLAVDGLGHGVSAAQAADEAVGLFHRDPLRSPLDLLQALHLGLRATRGAAIMVLKIDVASGAVACAGIGNISGKVIDPAGDRSFVSQNGTAGHIAKRFQEFAYSWGRDGLLVVHSDGIRSGLSLDPYPGLAARHPGLAAAILQSAFLRERDDSTLLVLRRR